MDKHLEVALSDAKAWLAAVDADTFLDEFLELQEHACGPTVDDFFENLNTSTSKLFGLIADDSVSYSNFGLGIKSIRLTAHDARYILNQFPQLFAYPTNVSANDVPYSFNDVTLKQVSEDLNNLTETCLYVDAA